MKIKEIEDFSDFIDLEYSWKKTLKQSKHTVFSTWEYLSTWWKYFGNKSQLKTLILLENDNILGIAPLMISEASYLKIGKIRKIQFIGHGADYSDIILVEPKENYLRIFLDYLLQLSDWDLLELKEINQQTPAAEILKAICHKRKPKLKLSVSSYCPYIELPASFQVFLNNLSRNKRKNLLRRMRRLEENYKVEFKTQNDFSSIKDAMKVFFRLHQKRWQSIKKDGAFATAINRNFNLELAEIFNQKGWLALRFLSVDGVPIAGIYSFDYNLKKYGFQTGFDPDFSKFGVGDLLKLRAVEECINKGFTEYDLTRGLEPYKMNWATGVRQNFTVRMVNNGWHAPLVELYSKIKMRLTRTT